MINGAKIENTIEAQYRELASMCAMNAEYSELYLGIEHIKLREILATLHYEFTNLFRLMNDRLPTGDYEHHFWAEPSRELIKIIEITLSLYHSLKGTEYAFEIEPYYFELVKKCRDFLAPSGGSKLPPNMEKVELYYEIPIFTNSNSITVEQNNSGVAFALKNIGNGSYANVFKYHDAFYDRDFVVKKAKKDLDEKEIERFRLEFKLMSKSSSPYVLEVFRFNEGKKEYVMEYMDYTLYEFIQKNNSHIQMEKRKSIIRQIFKAFKYLHSKNILHRDISPTNILLKEYHDVLVAKISDFGLAKIEDSTLTSANTEFKGCFNDTSLKIAGFNTYSKLHETFALTMVVFYTITGRTNVEKIDNPKLKEFVEKGLNPEKTLRFSSVEEMETAFNSLKL